MYILRCSLLFSSFSMDFLPVCFIALGSWISLEGLLSFLPVGWANFTVFISELESFNESQNFINVSTDWSVVDGHVSKDTLLVNDVGSSESDTFLLNKAAISCGDLKSSISEKWDLHVTETTFRSWLLAVFHMREDGVSGSTDDLAAKLLEFFGLVGEGDDFSWANESEVEWVPEEDDVLSLVVLEGNVLDTIVVGLAFEVWSSLEDLSDGCLSFDH
mmetsp:Transcript_11330/g.12947  ORF Transcript_11330/g.12947 Transcript_11330/m.12947 type:complete len:217 (+) Transcript_11330:111-761(+)